VAGVTFSDSESALFQIVLIRIWVRIFFKFENPTPVQTPAAIDPTETLQFFTEEMTTQTPNAKIEK